MHLSFSRTAFCFFCMLILLAIVATNGQSQSLIKNGNFSQWQDQSPEHWVEEIGAKDGADKPESKIEQGDDSVVLSGDATTTAWKLIHQPIDVKPGQTIKVSYAAMATKIKREGFQKDNCWVGVFFKSNGEKIPPQFWNVISKKFKQKNHTVKIPDNATQTDLYIFLSKTGRLEIKDVDVQRSGPIDPEESFDVLVEDMAKNYSFFEHKKIDWNALTEKYRVRASKAKKPERFANVVASMLAELKDIHTFVKFEGKTIQKFSSGYDPNFDFAIIKADLQEAKPIGRFGVVGKTKDGFQYVNILSLGGISDKEINEMKKQIISGLDSPGFIIDLRRNGGGSDLVAKQIAELFVKKKTLFSRDHFRDPNADASDNKFSQPNERFLEPVGKGYANQIVCLIGPGSVSSAESFAMMMKALPNCTLVGLPTRGSSGNPRPVRLPNGVEVYYSRWQSMLPDGTVIEDSGVPPDVEIKHIKGSDLAYKKAIELLKATGETNK